MPFLEILKDGAVVKRQQVDATRARTGCIVQLGGRQIRVFPGRPTRIEEYEARLVEDSRLEGATSAADKTPSRPRVAPSSAVTRRTNRRLPRLTRFINNWRGTVANWWPWGQASRWL